MEFWIICAFFVCENEHATIRIVERDLFWETIGYNLDVAEQIDL